MSQNKMTVQGLQEKIDLLYENNAFHVKRGFSIHQSTVASCSVHVLEEAVELQEACILSTDKWHQMEEAGDMLLVYLHLLELANINFDDVLAHASSKLDKSWTSDVNKITAKDCGMTRKGRINLDG